MDCWQVLEMQNAWLDGELNSEPDSELNTGDRAALEAHLAQCADCRAWSEGLRLQDADLRRAFAFSPAAAQRVAEQTAAQLRVEAARRSVLPTWLALLLATAAGFLMAVFLLRPGHEPEVIVEAPAEPGQISKPFARVALATGPVDVLPPGELNWFLCPSSGSIEPGASLRTATAVRCEVDASDKTEVRLNGDTQVRFADDRRLELAHGQLWSSVSGKAPLKVATSDAVVVAEQAKFDLQCRSGETLLTVVEGTARVEGKQDTRTVEAGHSATITAGEVSESRRVHDPLLATSWVNELLLLKGPDNPEFVARMNDILAQIGQAKMTMLYEDEVRRLGDHCVVPLVRYLESSRSAGNEPRRARAAAIVADVAQPRSIAELIGLLSDENSEVRFHAARALQRLTGRDQGLSAEQWQSQSWATCQPTHQMWLDWWEKNRHRYPGVTAATSTD